MTQDTAFADDFDRRACLPARSARRRLESRRALSLPRIEQVTGRACQALAEMVESSGLVGGGDGLRAATGVPIGVQIAGRTMDDATVFRIGAALEAIRPWLLVAPL